MTEWCPLFASLFSFTLSLFQLHGTCCLKLTLSQWLTYIWKLTFQQARNQEKTMKGWPPFVWFIIKSLDILYKAKSISKSLFIATYCTSCQKMKIRWIWTDTVLTSITTDWIICPFVLENVPVFHAINNTLDSTRVSTDWNPGVFLY